MTPEEMAEACVLPPMLGTGRFDWSGADSAVIPTDLRERIAAAIRAAVAEERGRTEKAVELAVRYGGIDGDHHKAWVIDQMVRALTGDDYARVVAEAKAGEDGPETYRWDVGIPP